MKYKILNFLRQIGLLLLVVWTVVSLVTLLIELVPGDPAIAVLGDNATPEQINNFRAKHGLDKPGFFFSYSRNEELYRRVLEIQQTPDEIQRREQQNCISSFFEDISTELKVRELKWDGADNRYLNYWKGVLTGDLGTSFKTGRPVLNMIFERYPNTIELAVAAMFIAILIA